MKEIWKPVIGFEGIYEVSNLGNIASLNYRGRNKRGLLKPKPHNGGYYRITLCKEKQKYDFLVHRLVADAFTPNPDNFPQVNHIDENKQNNIVSNLEWCTAKYNMNYGTMRERCASKVRGRPNPKKCKPLIAILPDGTEEYYKSAKEFGQLNGMKCSPSGNIVKVIKGTCKTAYGRKWKYADET